MRRNLCPRPRFDLETLEPRRFLTVISGFTETLIAGGMTRPVQMDFAPDGRLFITQQDGNLRIVKNGNLLSTPFVTVATHNKGERGLLGVTFDPSFETNHYVYLYYTHPEGNSIYRNRVSRFTANGDVAVAGSEKVLYEGDVLTGEWHNSGQLRFGLDGKLYFAMGENQQNSVAQSLTNTFGKIMRINSDGTIPTDNPFYNSTTGKYRAIWAYGLRNPFTFDVQPGTGRIFVNDVGAAFWEEINDLQKGANYGWPNSEGPTSNPAYTAPFHTYAHAGGDFDDSAITGAAFYNPANPTFGSDYVGDFFFGDYGTGFIKRIDPATRVVTTLASGESQITDVEVSDDGSLYFLSRTSGQLFRIQKSGSIAPTITVPPSDVTVAAGLTATFSVTAGGTNLSYQWQRNGDDIPGANSSKYTLDPAELRNDGDTFRVVVSNSTSSVTSTSAKLTVLDDKPPTATITLPSDDFKWTGGGSINFAGTGTDPEDGNLPAGAFTWEIVAHHDSHTHPFVAPYSGVTSDTVAISTIGETEANIWYRIHLTVTDSQGLSATTFKDVFPQKANLSLRTEPAGLKVNLDGASVQTPSDVVANVGLKRTLSAPATQLFNGVTYAFDHWSDNGAASHDVLMPAQDTTYTAIYKVSTQTTTTLRANADTYVRDGIYAKQNFGSATDLQVKTDGVDRTRWTYLSFNLTTVGSDITSAKLRLNGKLDNTLASSVSVSVFGGPTGWFENEMTWNTKPASDASAIRSFTVTGTTAKYYEIDLTDYVKKQKGFGATAVGVVLKAAASKATVVLSSDEATSNRPELVVQTGGGSVDPDPPPPPGPASSLRALADGYVRNGTYASTNFGSASDLQVKLHSSLGYTRETYLMFDLSAVTTISSAKLRLYGGLTESETVQTAVYIAESNWTETGLTWNQHPAVGAAAAATVTISSTTRKWYEWDLAAALQAEKAAGRNVVTLVLKNLSQTSATLTFASDEAATNRPELVVS